NTKTLASVHSSVFTHATTSANPTPTSALKPKTVHSPLKNECPTPFPLPLRLGLLRRSNRSAISTAIKSSVKPAATKKKYTNTKSYTTSASPRSVYGSKLPSPPAPSDTAGGAPGFFFCSAAASILKNVSVAFISTSKMPNAAVSTCSLLLGSPWEWISAR
ncbi:MAG: hypothetical protein Q9216_005314, partial [Gyalolechia sp. 2 TL-2023]